MDNLAGKPGPILCAPLLRVVDGKLIELLATLRPEEWALRTLAGEWTVRDVAGHLLDTVVRKLSLVRDEWIAEPVEIRSPEELASSEEFVGEGERQRCLSMRNFRNFLQVESNDLC